MGKLKQCTRAGGGFLINKKGGIAMSKRYILQANLNDLGIERTGEHLFVYKVIDNSQGKKTLKELVTNLENELKTTNIIKFNYPIEVEIPVDVDHLFSLGVFEFETLTYEITQKAQFKNLKKWEWNGIGDFSTYHCLQNALSMVIKFDEDNK